MAFQLLQICKSVGRPFTNKSLNWLQGFVEEYSSFLPTGYPSYNQIIKHVNGLPLASDEQEAKKPFAIYFHCSGGNNRTGVLAAVLLYLLGVSRESIAYEYKLTEIGFEKARYPMQQRLKARILKVGAYGGDDSLITQEMLDRMTSSRPEVILAILDIIDNTYGGILKYTHEVLKLNDEDIAKFREVMTVEASMYEQK